MSKPDNVLDDLKQAAADAAKLDASAVLADCVDAINHAQAGKFLPGTPGTSASTFSPTAAAAGVDIGQLAASAVNAQFIAGSLVTSPEQQASISQADAAVGKASAQVSSGAADSSTLGNLEAAYSSLGNDPESQFAKARIGAAMDQVRNDMAKRDAAGKLGASASETKNFNTVDDYLAFKRQEKEKIEQQKQLDTGLDTKVV